VPRKCSICTHKKRCQIEEELTRNAEYSEVARRYRVSADAIKRHVDNKHIPKATNREDDQRILNIQKCAQEIYDLCFGAAQEARTKDLKALGSCIAPAVKVLEILNKGNDPNKPPETPKESGFIKGYMKRAEEVYAKDQSPTN
jgi:hypothetical protein